MMGLWHWFSICPYFQGVALTPGLEPFWGFSWKPTVFSGAIPAWGTSIPHLCLLVLSYRPHLCFALLHHSWHFLFAILASYSIHSQLKMLGEAAYRISGSCFYSFLHWGMWLLKSQKPRLTLSQTCLSSPVKLTEDPTPCAATQQNAEGKLVIKEELTLMHLHSIWDL